MKKIIFFIGIFAGFSFLLSCSDADDSLPVSQADVLWYRGYFDGEINGKEISMLSAKANDTLINVMGYDYYLPDDSQDSVKGVQIVIQYSQGEVLHIDLYRPYVGVRYLYDDGWEWKGTGGIYISKFGKPNSSGYYKNDFYYNPDPEKPFRLEIISAFYESVCPPIVEVELDGTLYRSDNSNDSIVVKGIYRN